MYLAARPAVVAVHQAVVDYAVVVDKVVTAAHESRKTPTLAGGALFNLRADQVSLHRAILSLCEAGWAVGAGPILRTMLDILINVAVITEKRDQSEFRGFRYTYGIFKSQLNSPAYTDAQRKYFREQVRDGINHLPPEFRSKADNVIFKGKTPPYWFMPDFARPSAVIETLSTPDVQQLYKNLSSAAHGGFIGLRVFKDDPDTVHANPRADRRSQEMALLGSSRLTIEVVRACDRFEAHGVSEALSAKIMDSFMNLRP
jgi:hypothetical protein